MTFESSLAELADPTKKLSATEIVSFSSLEPPQLSQFTETWEETQPDRRLSLVTNLTELLEDNIELNFDAVFKLALGDEDPLVRAAAIAGLYEYEGSDLIRPLTDL